MKQVSRRSRSALTALLAGAGGIGIAPIWVRLSELGPSATAFYRLLFALPWFWLWLGWERRRRPNQVRPKSSQDYLLLTVAGLLFALDMAFWHASLRRTTVANATLLTNSAPIFVTIGARVLFQEPIRRGFVGGIAIAFAGIVLLTNASLDQPAHSMTGDVLALLAAIFYGGYMLCIKELRGRFSTATIMAGTGLAATMGLMAITWLSSESFVAQTARGWWILIALAMTSQSGGQCLIAYAFAHLPASFSSVSLLVQPVVAAGLAWAWLGEPMGGRQILGGLIVLAGIVICRRASV